MARPDIVNVTSILSKNAFYSNVPTTEVNVLSNPQSSNKVFKINSIIAANRDGTNDATVDVSIKKSTGTTTYWYVGKQLEVPADTSLVITSKETSFYLEEYKAIYALASAASDISLMISYDEIDDA